MAVGVFMCNVYNNDELRTKIDYKHPYKAYVLSDARVTNIDPNETAILSIAKLGFFADVSLLLLASLFVLCILYKKGCICN